MINNYISPLEDTEMQRLFNDRDRNARSFSLRASTDPEEIIPYADFAVIATPTDYNPKCDSFDTTSIENSIKTNER